MAAIEQYIERIPDNVKVDASNIKWAETSDK